MKTGVIQPTRGRKWFVPWARYDQCTCSFGNGETYSLRYEATTKVELSIADSTGQRLATIQNLRGFKAWLVGECCIVDARSEEEIARFNQSEYADKRIQGGSRVAARTYFKHFRLIDESPLYKITCSIWQSSPVAIELFDERITLPVTLMAFAKYAAPDGGAT